MKGEEKMSSQKKIMENNPILDSDFETGAGLELSNEATGFLHETSRWAQFLAILGFIGAGFMFFIGLFIMAAGASLGLGDALPFSPAIFGFIYLIIGAVYALPVMYLYRFATQTKTAVARADTNQLTEGLGNLKSSFKFMGIMAITLIGLYILILIGAVIFGASGAMGM